MRSPDLFARLLILTLLAGCPTTTDDDDASDDDAGDDDTAPPPCDFVAPTAWEDAGALPSARESMAVVGYGGGLILLGGWTGAAASDEVSTTSLDGGQIDSWTSQAPLPVGLEHHAALIHDGALYVLGGDDGSDGRTEVYWVLPAETLGSWNTTTPLPSSRVFHAAVSYGDSIYVIGGLEGFGSARATVYRGDVGDDHEIGGWVEARALPDARYAHGALVHGDYLYVLGGAFSGSAATQTSWRAPFEEDGALGEWESAMALPAAVLSHGATLAGDRVLLTGGLEAWTSSSDETASALLGGGPVTWGPAAPLPTPRFAHGAVRVGDDVLLLGGWEDFTVGIHDTILRAQICQ